MVIKEDNIMNPKALNDQSERVLQATDKLVKEFNSFLSILENTDESVLDRTDRWYQLLNTVCEDLDNMVIDISDILE